MIDALRRLGKEIFSLIDQEQYFIIHAARQSGKTTLLMELIKHINEEGKYYALYCSLETIQDEPDAAIGIPAIIKALNESVCDYGLPEAPMLEYGAAGSDYQIALERALKQYCKSLDKPLVILFDEVDCLNGKTLISFLRQLRSGYVKRALIPFVHSLVLTGMRNIRDYRDEYRLPEQTLGSASPFNIVKTYLTLSNFTHDEIAGLYIQHTDETGQVFEEAAIKMAWNQTQGQPWLVNAIACEIIEKITKENPQEPITADMVSSAIQSLIIRRDTHFDSLMARLHEERVRRVIEPIIIGKSAAINRFSDDYSYVKDLGLIRDDQGKTEPSNPIYAETIIRALNWDSQKDLEEGRAEYQIPRYLSGGIMDMDLLLSDFQVFWRENSDIWRKKYDYQEAAPQLILQAFLQRVLNGGGQIVREMAAATGRADICVIYQDKKYPIEMKIRYSNDTYAEGVEQILGYMDILGCDKGWLVVFDHRATPTWEERLFCRDADAGGKTVKIYGC